MINKESFEQSILFMEAGVLNSSAVDFLNVKPLISFDMKQITSLIAKAETQ